MNKKLVSLIKMAWIILGVCAVMFFAVAVTVYAAAKPNTVTELLVEDGSWLDIKTLTETDGDLEKYPYVTRVYSCGIDEERAEIQNVMHYDYKMPYGVITDDAAEHNYLVECFVYSNAADKSVVKRFWNMTAEYDKKLIITQSEDVRCLYGSGYFGDIKREDDLNDYVFCKTFIRITARTGCDDIVFKNVMVVDGEVYEFK